jgi:hypothetical protein
MNFPKAVALLCGGLTLAGVLYAFQRPFRQFNGIEHRIGETPLPNDYQEKAEWAFARLMYPPGEGGIATWTGTSATPSGPRIFRPPTGTFRRAFGASHGYTCVPWSSA